LSDAKLRVFTARTILTVNPSLPRAEAVAVRDGRIVEVGTLESLRPWLDAHPHEIDDRFKDDVITPGLIDPHLHPGMAAVILPMEFITAMEWRLPWETVPATTTPEAFDARLAEKIRDGDPDELLIVWGHHELWHGPISRERIGRASPTRPVVVWNRSFHELCMNDAALARLGIDAASIGDRPQIDLERGRFYEVGLGYAIQRLNPYLLAPERFEAGLERLKQVVHFGGQTTIADMAVGIFDFETELAALGRVFERPDNPFRIELIPHGLVLGAGRSTEELTGVLDALPERNTERLRFARRIKLFADGAFFAQAAQLMEPGYIDGHHGEWLMAPEQLEAAARLHWHRDYRIHVHVCGDLGVELALDILEKLQRERPRFDHGFTLEHFGYSTPEQVTRAAALGASVSANVYYLHELSDMYARYSVGYERASTMARIGSCFRAGVTTALHSDFTMAPAQPLNSMWVAVNRINAQGDVMGPEERLTPEQGLEAITLNAARVIGRDAEIGSIRAGKKADFTVLAEDPLAVDPRKIRDIEIRATVFDGRVFPVALP